MEESNSNTINNDENYFFETLDEFPFYECIDYCENDSPISQSSPNSLLQPIEESNADALHKFKPRRRITFSQHDSGNDSKGSNPDSSVSFGINDARVADTVRKFRFLRNLKGNEGEREDSDLYNVQFGSGRNNNCFKGENKPESVITDANNEGTDDESYTVHSHVDGVEESSSNFLFSLAGLVIKGIGKVNLVVRLITFPIWLLYSSFMFITDPFHLKRRCTEYLTRILLRIFGAIYGSTWPLVFEWLKEHKLIWKLGLRLGWGLLWSVYICFILSSLLVFALFVSGLAMRVLVKEPFQMKETLNFDYTKNSPVAFVPITSCPAASCGVNCKAKIETGNPGKSRIVPPNQKLHGTVKLMLPESDYNRNLGIFQVRVDLLSANGYARSSSRHHSMMQFRSQPIRLLLTFLKLAPLLTGFYSETQTLNINFRGLTEGDNPTACLRVIIEQRAEFRAGAGVPEVYAASINLESELPLLNRILWYWKKTIFIWLSMTVFTVELLFALLYCKPLIIPRARLRTGFTNHNRSASQNVSPVQR